MSLTVPTYWKAASKNASVQESWLIQLGYGTGSSYIGISDTDVIIDTVQYHGIVQDFGQITEKINLAKSKAAIGNVQISCVNKYGAGKLTDLFFTGTDTTEHLNRDVRIYSRMGDADEIAECVEIYRSRLVKVDFDPHYVTLYLEQSYPWWDIKIPQNLSKANNYEPIAYGNFLETTNNGGAQTTYAKYPCPFERRDGGLVKYVCNQVNGSELHYYDKGLDGFLKITAAATSSDTEGDVEILEFSENMARTLYFFPVTVNTGDTFTNSENVITGGTGSATATDTMTATDSGTYYLRVNIPTPQDGAFTALTIEADCSVNLANASGYGGVDDCVTRIEENTFGSTDTIVERYWAVSGTGTTTNGSYSRNVLTPYQSSYSIPEYIELKATFTSVAGGGDTIDCTATVNSVYMSGTITLNDGSEYDWIKRADALKSIKEAYSGGDGFSKGYTSGSGRADLAHEIHRDILNRFVGLDDTDGASSVGWSSLNTDRSSWDCLYWIKKPTPIQDILEKLQYEGCFVFTLEADGGFKYIHIEDSYSSGDVVYTLDADDFNEYPIVGTTDLSQIVTEQVFNFKKHPAENRYTSTDTFTNTSSRSGYWKSILTDENSVTINLDALANPSYITTSTNPNSSIGSYYDNIYGEPKVLVKGTLVNPGKFDLQNGDIVKFSLEYDPFAKSWSSLYFMIVETKRTVGKMDIVAREVYSS